MLDKEIQTRPALADIARKHLVTLGQAENPQRLIHGLRHGKGACERPDILRAIVELLLCRADNGPFPAAYSNIMIALIVLQKDIIFGLVLLDEAAFKHKRLKFAIRQDIVKIRDVFHHPTHLDRMVLLRAEILTDAVFQGLCLANIDDRPLFVLHDINARRKGETHRLFTQGPQMLVQSGHPSDGSLFSAGSGMIFVSATRKIGRLFTSR